MRVSKSWLDERLKNNPFLSVSNVGKNAINRTGNEPGTGEPSEKAAPKYRNVKVYVYQHMVCYGYKLEGKEKPLMVFDSIKEYERWNTLLLMQRGGVISQLRRQVPLLISEQSEYRGQILRKTEYKADFMYIKGDETIVEDVKEKKKKKGQFRTTEAFNLKWKLLKKRYPNYTFLLV